MNTTSNLMPSPSGPPRFRRNSAQTSVIPKEDQTPSPLGPKASTAGMLSQRLSQSSRNQALSTIPGAGKKKRMSLQERLMSSA